MFKVIFWEGTNVVDTVDFDDSASALKYKKRAIANYKLGAVTIERFS